MAAKCEIEMQASEARLTQLHYGRFCQALLDLHLVQPRARYGPTPGLCRC